MVEIEQTNTNNGSGTDKRVDLSYTATGRQDRVSKFELHDGVAGLAVVTDSDYDSLDRLIRMNHFRPADAQPLAFYEWDYGVDARIDSFRSADGTDTYDYDAAVSARRSAC